MPIGIVSDDLFSTELSRLSSVKKQPTSQVITPEIVEMEKPGRKEGDVDIPNSLRQIIGETSVIDGRKAALNLAQQFGISPSSVSAYAKGATSTASYDSPKPEIIQHINKSRARASKKAGAVLKAALGAITQDKLDYTDAKDLASIAKDMTVVIKNLEPKIEGEGSGQSSNTPQFVIFAPQFRDERSFEVVTVQE